MHTVEPSQPTVSKLQTLTLYDVDVFSRLYKKLLEILKRRHDRHVGLKNLVVQSCRVPTVGYKEDLKGLVKKVIWDNVMDMGSDYCETGTEEETESEEFDDSDYYGYERHWNW
jgi:hypothetical protein